MARNLIKKIQQNTPRCGLKEIRKGLNHELDPGWDRLVTGGANAWVQGGEDGAALMVQTRVATITRMGYLKRVLKSGLQVLDGEEMVGWRVMGIFCKKRRGL